MFPDRFIKRLPGAPGVPETEKQGYISDLNSKSKVELLELLERQNKILSNKKFIAQLPDKGKKISEFKCKVEEALKKKSQVDRACDLLSSLNLNGKIDIDEIEWKGEVSKQKKKHMVDSDDENDTDNDPLKILASQNAPGSRQKQNRILKKKKDESLINPEDVAKATVLQEENKTKEDPYVKPLLEKIESASKVSKKDPFLPYKTLKSDKRRDEKPSSNVHMKSSWEVTAATPPIPVFGDVKPISIQESLELQKVQAEKLKEVQVKHAAEKLAMQMGVQIGDHLPRAQQLMNYRDADHGDSDSNSDEDALDHEEEDDDHRDTGGVVYTYNH